MGDLAAWLSGPMKGPVIDQTGLAGNFNFTLRIEYQVESSVESVPDGLGGASTRSADESDYISAVRKLGLNLDRMRTAVPVLVIDHIEKPTAN